MSFVLSIVLSLLQAATDTYVTAYAVVEPPVAPFHQQPIYSLIVEAPQGANVSLPQMTGHFGGLDVYRAPKREIESLGDGRQRITDRYTLDPIIARDYSIEPAKITYSNGESFTVPSVGVRIRDLTEDEMKSMELLANFAPNLEYTPIPSSWLDYWYLWLPAALPLIALLAALAYRYRRLRKTTVFTPPPQPWEVAYKRLKDLDQKQLPQSNAWEPYYVELSDILRHYIEERFHLRAPEQTTQEFLTAASTSGVLSDAHQQLLAAFLRYCDRVKFAKLEPTMEDMEQSFAQVLMFVDETVPKQEPVEEKAA